MPWGLNVSLCIMALVAATATLARRHGVRLGPDTAPLALSALLLAAAFVRRASPWLAFFDLVALAGVLVLAVAATRGLRFRALGVGAYARSAAQTLVRTALGAPGLALLDIRWRELPAHGPLARLRAAGLGLLLAVPLLAVFGALFAAADTVFRDVVTTVFALDLGVAAGHVALAGALGSCTAGYLAAVLLPRRSAAATPATTVTLGIVPVGTALGLVNLLFLLFVVIQIRYLFGGADLVQETTGLTLAQYARSGFFELVCVSALTLPLLLVADWALRAEAPAGRATFRRLAGLTLLLLAVVMASALERMRLYVAEFGLSEIRLYATAFMGYLLVLFAWFATTVLRARRSRFAFGGALQGLAVLGALHVANPDALIARVNLDRAGRDAHFDGAYLASYLSADAVPLLLDRLPRLEASHRCRVAGGLLGRWAGASREDWRSWNWSRARARALVRARADELRAAPCAPITNR